MPEITPCIVRPLRSGLYPPKRKVGGSFPHLISTDESHPKEKRRRKRENGKRIREEKMGKKKMEKK